MTLAIAVACLVGLRLTWAWRHHAETVARRRAQAERLRRIELQIDTAGHAHGTCSVCHRWRRLHRWRHGALLCLDCSDAQRKAEADR